MYCFGVYFWTPRRRLQQPVHTLELALSRSNASVTQMVEALRQVICLAACVFQIREASAEIQSMSLRWVYYASLTAANRRVTQKHAAGTQGYISSSKSLSNMVS